MLIGFDNKDKKVWNEIKEMAPSTWTIDVYTWSRYAFEQENVTNFTPVSERIIVIQLKCSRIKINIVQVPVGSGRRSRNFLWNNILYYLGNSETGLDSYYRGCEGKNR